VFEEVRIQGVGVIDDAVLELSPGLNVVTGETGAGKTMVVSGLGLLLGMRADAGLVRVGRRAAVVEGVVRVPPGHPALIRAEEAGADVADALLLARTVGADGRSRAHVGGRSTPIGVLTEIGETLVAVHGQADQWRLRQGDQHRDVLDGFGGEPVTAALRAYRTTFDALSRASAERDRLRQQAHERAREIDLLQGGLERIEALNPEPGEDVALRAEDERLSHADGLRLAAANAHAYLVGRGYLPLAGEDGYAAESAPPVVDALASARAALSPVTDHDAALRELEGRVAELGYLAADLAADLASYLNDVDVDPARLTEVQQRRADLAGLTRRYGDTVDDVLAWGKEAAATLGDLVGADDRVQALEAETARLREQLGGEASALSAARTTAAEEFGRRVTDELAHLAMGGAVVTVAVTSRDDADGLAVGKRSVRWTRSGVDDVEILLASGPGNPARTVAKAASGGELSRVMLAIEVVGRTTAVPTFVFDEVDAGVGGRAAVDVGARLATLAQQAQVVVVTHLAQVAAFADRHLVVRKSDDGVVTSSNVAVLEGNERLQELSRMMGGDATSSAGLTHARELLDQAAAQRKAGSDRP
jgi:DNA repair protein RecN (Recombination protein N)